MRTVSFKISLIHKTHDSLKKRKRERQSEGLPSSDWLNVYPNRDVFLLSRRLSLTPEVKGKHQGSRLNSHFCAVNQFVCARLLKYREPKFAIKHRRRSCQEISKGQE